MKHVVLVAALAVVAAVAVVLLWPADEDEDAPPLPPDRPAPRASEDPAAHVAALQRIADRSGDTRAAGTVGERRTVDYLVATLRAAGWRVRTQPVRFPYFDLRKLDVEDLVATHEVRAAQYSGSGSVRARVRAVAGRGCSPGDYAALRRGEIALAHRGTCFFRDKARLAQRAGASALIAVDTYGRTPVSASLIRPGVRIPVVIVAGAAGRRLAGRRLRLTVDASSEHRRGTNVIAESPQGGRGRWIMAGAHHDSVGAGPGMNDNGSGIAALLAFAARARDVRGVRLGFWAAEELGIYGSRRYVRSLRPPDRRRIAGYVNIDMIGSRNARVRVYDRDNRIERVLRRAVGGREGEAGLHGASDHAPFERAGIPVGGLLSGATSRGRRAGPADRCYHRSCDTIRNVDTKLLSRMTDATERALRRLAG